MYQTAAFVRHCARIGVTNGREEQQARAVSGVKDGPRKAGQVPSALADGSDPIIGHEHPGSGSARICVVERGERQQVRALDEA